MTTSFFRSAALLALAAGLTAATAQAQMPTDNPVWKTRCNLLAASAADISKGATPATLVAATRGISGQPSSSSLAAESSDCRQPQRRLHSSSISPPLPTVPATAASPILPPPTPPRQLAASERKLIAGQSISISDHMAWTGIKFSLMRAGGL